MPGTAPSGASLHDAIDLDVSEDEDAPSWPPARSNGSTLNDMQREISDSPPPLIVKSNIRQTAKRGQASPSSMSTRQRLRAAVQPSKEGTPNSSQSALPTSSKANSGRTFAPVDLNTSSQIPVVPARTQAAASPSENGNVFPPFYRHPPTGIPSPGILVPSTGQIAGHDILLRQVIGIRPRSNNALNLTHGQVLTASQCMTLVEDRPYHYLLHIGNGPNVAEWNGIEATDLALLAARHNLKLVVRYLNPAVTPVPDVGQKFHGHPSHYAVLEIQFPQQGRFSSLHVNQIRGKFALEMRTVEKTFGSSLMPSSLGIYHFILLSAIIKLCEEVEKKYGPTLDYQVNSITQSNQAQPSTLSTPGSVLSSFFKSPALKAFEFKSPALKSFFEGLMEAEIDQIFTPARSTNTLSAASPLNMNTASGSSMPSFNSPIPTTSAQVLPKTYYPPGAWPSTSAMHNLDGMDDDAILSQLEMMNQSTYDDSGEPIDADMREILNNMADGTFHGSDALATLYGDRGVDVAKLSLYSDTKSLKERGLKTALHDHQLQGLLWMIKAEHRRVSKTDGKSQALWITKIDGRGKPYYLNVATRKCKRIAPILPRGGINSDSMGLGKTIQIIATCLADPNRVPKGIKPKSRVVDVKEVDVKADDEAIDSKPLLEDMESKEDIKSIKVKTSNSAQAGPSTAPQQEEQPNDDNEDDETDSEEDYESDYDDSSDGESHHRKQKKKKKPMIRRRTSDSSVTEEEEEEESIEESSGIDDLQPINSEGMAAKMVSSSETESEEEETPMLGNRKRKIAQKANRNMSNKAKRSKVEGKEAESSKKKAPQTDKKASKAAVKSQNDKINYNNTTLIICPLSVLQNWTGQVNEHCDKKKVSYYTYHSDSAKAIRTSHKFATALERHNFVFTTYDTVRMEYRVIQKRREAKLKRMDLEEDNRKASVEGVVVEEEKKGLKSIVDRDSKGKAQEDTSSREQTEDSEGLPVSDDDNVKPNIKGKGKGKQTTSNKRKSQASKFRFDSDDSFLASDDEEEGEDGSVSEEKVDDDPRDIPLFEINWKRIVLDEAHICRNPRTVLYNAICELKAERRWAVTGTPIVNSTKDLGALAAWCGLQPFADSPTEWSRLIERRLKKANQSEQAAGLLRRVVTSICLRRHKSMKNSQGDPIVKLPDIKFYKHTIPLTMADRDYYGKCELACRDHLARWARQGDLNEHRSAILEFLLRLRQMSCHRRLIGSKLLEEIQNKDWDSIDKAIAVPNLKLTKETIEMLQGKLKMHVEMNDDCPICMETLTLMSVITPCGHPFCKACLGAVIGKSFAQAASCPMDRSPLPAMEQMIELPADSRLNTPDEELQEEGEEVETTSAKVRECMKIIRATLKRDPTEKILVFSNFVSFLNVIAEEVKDAGISHARFNGGLDVKRRDAVLKSFCRPISPRQGLIVKATIARLEEKLQREKAAQKAAAAAAATLEAQAQAQSHDAEHPSSDASSHKSSSSSLLLNSLRSVDKNIGTTVNPKTKGKRQRAQDNDVFGENPSILFISMGCGALGLNLTVASTVLLMDPWWQSSLEQQSIDRTHRIGQTRDVKVFQIIAENTVEARVLDIQAAKEGLAETAFSGIRATGSASERRTTVNTSLHDLGRLFGMSTTEVQEMSRNVAANAAARRA